MTTEQIEMTRVIAEYDGWKVVKRMPSGYGGGEPLFKYITEKRVEKYITSLDWLHPLAIKVMGMLNHLHKVSRDRKFMDLAEQIKVACSRKPINGQYIDLFTAVFNGIVFLNEKTVKP